MRAPDQTTVIPRLRDVKPPKHDPWGEDGAHPATPVGDPQVPVHAIGVWPWLLPAAVMAVLGLVGITGPALWSDELATWGMATASWTDMVAVLRLVDAIIGPYYALVHLWTDLVGVSDLTLRLPSLVAMTGAAGLVGALGARLATPRVGVTAGLIFALLPSSSRFAQEARTYALTTFVAVLATWLLIAALRRGGLLRWTGYLLTVAALGVLHPIALLLLGAHGWVVFAQYRRRTPPWAIAGALGVLPALPLLKYGNSQKSQVSWITTPTADTLLDFPAELAGVGFAAVLLIVLSVFSLPLRRPTALYTAWAVLPVLGLFAVAQLTPLFLARYLMFTLPAWALLAAVALGRGHRAWSVLGVVAVGAIAVPAHLDIRSDDGHGLASRELATTIADNLRPGDGVVYGMTDDGGNWVGRDTIAHYAPPGGRPADVLMKQAPRTNGQLAALECADVAECLGDTPRLWIVRQGYHEDPLTGLDGTKESVIRERYQVGQIWRQRGFTLALAETSSTPR